MTEYSVLRTLLEQGRDAIEDYGHTVQRMPTTSAVGARMIAFMGADKTVVDMETLKFSLVNRKVFKGDIENYWNKMLAAKVTATLNETLKWALSRAAADSIAEAADGHLDSYHKVADPYQFLEDMGDMVEEYQDLMAALEDTAARNCTDFAALIENLSVDGCTRWRSDELNKTIGPLYPGLFVVMTGRPEAAKTTMMCSELTHLLETSDDPEAEIIVFNNESHGDVLRLRLMCAAISWSKLEILSNMAAAQDA